MSNMAGGQELSIQRPVLPLSFKQWFYRGEGGANLVISVPELECVVRFVKTKYSDKQVAIDTKVDFTAFFANQVMGPMLGHWFVRPLAVAYVGHDQFVEIKQGVQEHRPCHRRKLKDIEWSHVLLSSDCTLMPSDLSNCATSVGPTYCVEIKPKQGWHNPYTQLDQFHLSLCNHCLKQFAKRADGESDVISSYCPLDLFSADNCRMKRAIFGLLDRPFNKLRIFRNGSTVYSDRCGGLSDLSCMLSTEMFGECKPEVVPHLLASILIESLLHPFGDDTLDKKLISVKYDCRSPLPNQLPPSSATACDTSRSCPGQTMLPSGCILQRLLKLQCLSVLDERQADLIYRQSDKSAQMELANFLLTATAKDLSLMLTFRRLYGFQSADVIKLADNVRLLYIPELDSTYEMCISAIDLDPKSAHRISGWSRRKQRWINTYAQTCVSCTETE